MIAVAKNLKLPLEVVTETTAILGIRGSGKTNTAVVITEGLLTAGQQVVVIDPTDAWWGLRSSKDGKHAGFPIVVFGGRHGDIPLNAGDGNVVADAIVDNRIPAILSLRHFESQADQRRLVTDFVRRIYHRKGEEGRDTPLLVAIDEAHLFCPQRVGAAEVQMVGAIQKLVRQGRSSGIGMVLIDQRAASVNKDLLTQLELLICHRTSSPQDRKALEAWIEQHDTSDHKKEFLARLPALERGTAWFWSPGWLDIFQETHVRERSTFDSSATPKAGERAIAPTTLASIDLDTLRTKLSATIEKAEADDPKKLRARIAELEREIKQSRPVAVTQEVSVLSKTDITVLESQLESLAAVEAEWREAVNEIGGYVTQIGEWATMVRDAIARVKTSGIASRQTAGSVAVRRASSTINVPKSAPPFAGKLGKGERACMIAIAQHDDGVTREQLTQLTGYKRSTRDAYIQRLAQATFVNVSEHITATEDGRAWLGSDYEPLPTGDALRSHWINRLPEGERAILAVACEAYPDSITRDAISDATKFKRSTRDAYVQRLVARRLLHKNESGRVRAVETLFS